MNNIMIQNKKKFRQRIVTVEGGDRKVNIHGCNCKNSRCKKFYCECLKNGVGCSSLCRCEDCMNSKFEMKEELVKKMKQEFGKKNKWYILKLYLQKEKK